MLVRCMIYSHMQGGFFVLKGKSIYEESCNYTGHIVCW